MTQTLGSLLKACRLARGLTRPQLAKLAGVKDDHIRYIEHGYVDFPRKKTLQRITSVLGVKVVVALVSAEGEEV